MKPQHSMPKKRPDRLIRTILSALALTAVMTACGDDAPVPGQGGRTATQILSDSSNALLHASSYHVDSSTRNGVTVTTFHLDVAGDNAVGTVSKDTDWTLRVTYIGDTIYVAGRDYWVQESNSAAVTLIGDRCVKVAPYSDKVRPIVANFLRYADTKGYAKSLVTPSGEAVIDGTGTTQGKAAIRISDRTSSLLVDPGRVTYPLHIDITFGRDAGYIDFSKFNQLNHPITAPTGCADLQQLDQSASSSGPGNGTVPSQQASPEISPPS